MLTQKLFKKCGGSVFRRVRGRNGCMQYNGGLVQNRCYVKRKRRLEKEPAFGFMVPKDFILRTMNIVSEGAGLPFTYSISHRTEKSGILLQKSLLIAPLQKMIYKSYDHDFDEHEFIEGVKVAFELVRKVFVAKSRLMTLGKYNDDAEELFDEDEDLEETSEDEWSKDEIEGILHQVLTPTNYQRTNEFFEFLADNEWQLNGEVESVENISIAQYGIMNNPDGTLTFGIRVEISSLESIHLSSQEKLIRGSENTRIKNSSWVFSRNQGESSEWQISSFLM